MQKPICVSTEHGLIIEQYIKMLLELMADVSTTDRLNNYKDVLEIIIEYNNAYQKEVERGNYYDFLMIIPVQLSIMTNGYLAGIENQKNRKKVRAYKYLIGEHTHDLMLNINRINVQYE